jgi:hypothetical protein
MTYNNRDLDIDENEENNFISETVEDDLGAALEIH